MNTDVRPAELFHNPIRAHDVPDPDVIALDEGGYALVASSFDRRPGLPLWWSEDLVSWEPAGFAGGWQPLVQPSGGVWAPSIRQHDGRLFITWGDPDRGIYVVDAPALAGPWSEPRLIIAGAGLIDPCPFWDEDGSAWIVHGWARSRAGFANRLSLVAVDPRLTSASAGSRTLVDGDQIDGCSVLEGPKLYRRGEHYWVFAPAGGVETGWQYAFRATSLDGPWEHRVVLQQGSTETNGPHQGAWVAGVDGEEWFLHFQHTPHHGRILHLQPLAWTADDWPLIGAAVTGGAPEPVSDWPRPARRPAAHRPERTLDWHGRDADPREIVEEWDADGRIRIAPGGALGRPLPVGTTLVEVTLVDGDGFLAIAGQQTREVHATGPAVMAVRIDGERARMLVDGDPVGEEFAVRAPQWTGIEYAIGSDGPGAALFRVSP